LVSEEIELFGLGLFFAMDLGGEDGVCLCERGYDVGWLSDGCVPQDFVEIGESVSDVFEFVVEVFAVPVEPVLEGFEEVSGDSSR